MRVSFATPRRPQRCLLHELVAYHGKVKTYLTRLRASNRVIARFLGADADGRFDITDKNLAVSNLARSRRPHDGFDSLRDKGVGQNNLNLDLRKKIDRIFAAAVNFGVALLAAKTLDLRNGHALRAHSRQRLFNFLEFERFNDGVDFFHGLRLAHRGY